MSSIYGKEKNFLHDRRRDVPAMLDKPANEVHYQFLSIPIGTA
jgi:hypothetical protein